METKTIFCAKCQTTTSHSGYMDGYGDLIFTCTNCERFIKVPARMKKEEVEAFLKAHEEANKGRVNFEEQQKFLKELLKDN